MLRYSVSPVCGIYVATISFEKGWEYMVLSHVWIFMLESNKGWIKAWGLRLKFVWLLNSLSVSTWLKYWLYCFLKMMMNNVSFVLRMHWRFVDWEIYSSLIQPTSNSTWCVYEQQIYQKKMVITWKNKPEILHSTVFLFFVFQKMLWVFWGGLRNF